MNNIQAKNMILTSGIVENQKIILTQTIRNMLKNINLYDFIQSDFYMNGSTIQAIICDHPDYTSIEKIIEIGGKVEEYINKANELQSKSLTIENEEKK